MTSPSGLEHRALPSATVTEIPGSDGAGQLTQRDGLSEKQRQAIEFDERASIEGELVMYRPKLRTRLGLTVPSTLGEVEGKYDRHLEQKDFNNRELYRRQSMQQLQHSVVAVSHGVSEAKKRREAITSALSQRDLLSAPA